MYKLTCYSLSFLLLTFFFISCSKDKHILLEDPKKPACRITSIEQGAEGYPDRERTTIEYDNQGRISALRREDGFKKTFTYQANTITILESDPIDTSGKVIITLGSNNKPQQIDIMDYKTNEMIVKREYSYNAAGELLEVKNYSNGSTNYSTITYQYQNGNATSISMLSGSTPTKLEYYLDKTNRDGDFIYTSEIMDIGIQTVFNKNLLKSYTYDNGRLNLEYEFDTSDRIVKMDVATIDGLKLQYYYGYQCD